MVVIVRPSVAFPLLNESLVDERVQVRVEPAVVDLLLVVVFEFFLVARPCGSSLPAIVYRRSRWNHVSPFISLHYGSISTGILLSREVE